MRTYIILAINLINLIDSINIINNTNIAFKVIISKNLHIIYSAAKLFQNFNLNIEEQNLHFKSYALFNLYFYQYNEKDKLLLDHNLPYILLQFMYNSHDDRHEENYLKNSFRRNNRANREISRAVDSALNRPHRCTV